MSFFLFDRFSRPVWNISCAPLTLLYTHVTRMNLFPHFYSERIWNNNFSILYRIPSISEISSLQCQYSRTFTGVSFFVSGHPLITVVFNCCSDSSSLVALCSCIIVASEVSGYWTPLCEQNKIYPSLLLDLRQKVVFLIGCQQQSDLFRACAWLQSRTSAISVNSVQLWRGVFQRFLQNDLKQLIIIFDRDFHTIGVYIKSF